jgi:hypothetical protein
MVFVADGSRKLGYPWGILKKHYIDYTSAALLDVNVLSFIIETFFAD